MHQNDIGEIQAKIFAFLFADQFYTRDPLADFYPVCRAVQFRNIVQFGGLR